MRLPRRKLLGAIGSIAALPATMRSARAAEPRLLQGPMVGSPGAGDMTIWSRASGPFQVAVEYADNAQMVGARMSPPVTAHPDDDYTVRNRLAGLEPGTRYYYRMYVSGERPRYQRKLPPFSFRTAPSGSAPFRIAYGSCLRVELDQQQRIWEAVAAREPDLFLWLGDNIYGDALRAETLAEEYRKQRVVPALQPVLRSAGNLAIWDDHDYGLNDGDRTSTVKVGALGVFRNYWANPAHGLPHTPGVFFDYHYGGVHFIFLDGRYYRDPNKAENTPQKTQLGAAQKAWLKEKLRGSDAVFKVLVSGGGWSKAKGPHGDGWSAFLHERDEIFDFIRDEGIGGVIGMSGDTHCAELNCVPRSETGGYDFYDLGSSPMAQDTDSDWAYRRPERRMREPYDGGPNFGVIDFDATAERPWIESCVVNEYGQNVWEPLRIYADELVNGARTWPDKMDGDARAWHRLVGQKDIADA
ncbi:alkaline phosphatase D family protein [Stakelama saccharophila]|uniref:Alkaline phosphatase D family protein n=1 Tax=Stakelama saccharophila TaxID=3075605 RepID=A0ABZ0B4V2_9SPHN|nr:alkaline phosphatase D family protein [Stakelama sp. W311]WNO52415.1 alkaline phosphatase D family protein [Stakelama sp. W311]